MKMLGLCLILLVPTFSAALGQSDASAPLPTITLSLPADVSSEGAQIDYFLTGPFGGYGKLVQTGKGITTYEIAASVDGKPATNVKVVAYFPGCAIETFEFKTLSATQTQPLNCNPTRQITLRGQIPADAIPQNEPVEIHAVYLALWTHEFFGIADGMVLSIPVAKAAPAPDGSFEIEVPDLSSQSKLGEAAFELTLRQAKTGKVVATLKPADEAGNAFGLEVHPDYPQLIQFTTDRR
jgi:hypothetical protein